METPVEIDCSQFDIGSRKRSICDGTSGLDPAMEEAYRRLWVGQQPAEPDFSCHHRGEHVDWVDCPTCRSGKVKLKIFECAVHTRCVIAKDVEEIKGCVGCPDQNPRI